LLFLLALSVGAPWLAAFAAGALFAVLPGPTEAVANVVGRAEVLAGLCRLAAVLVVREATPSRERRASWGAGALVLLGLGSKEPAICALTLMAAAELLFRPRKLVDRLAMLAPSVLAVVVYLIL